MVALAIAALPLFACAAPVVIRLPAEVTAFKQDKGAEIANAQCLICHSVEYVTTQPPLPRAFWKGSIQKMQQKYGASIPDEQIEPLTDYLTRNYGAAATGVTVPSTANQPPLAESSSAKTAPPAAPELAAKYGCSACHNATAKVIGPALRDIAAKYKGDSNAVAKIEEQIHQGGSGKWGPIIMPPFPQTTAEETKILAEWILKPK